MCEMDYGTPCIKIDQWINVLFQYDNCIHIIAIECVANDG